jgi:succinyl-diaminopimelate desuccinylase
MSKTIQLAQSLIKIDSVTPNDKVCQALMTDPVFVFAGHTDVVPVGDTSKWDLDPFSGEVKDGMLHGRGAADMKGSLAAMLDASERFVKDYPDHKGTIGYLITSDEEGPAVNGTVKVCEHLNKIGQNVDYCLVGEPSATNVLGDVIKNGRRGSLNGTLTIVGKQGHIAYPHLANNPIHLAVPVLNELCEELWDKGNEYFPATSFQVSNIHSGTGVTNVIPGTIEVVFNFRYSTESTHEGLQKRVCDILDKHNLKYEIDWNHSGYPFLTPKGDLVASCVDAIKKVMNVDTQLSTSGGTSDGRFIAPILNAQVVELGPINATIHQVNECVSAKDLNDLSEIYYHILKNILV